MRFDSPHGWADRMEAAVRAASVSGSAHRFEFLGSCVGMDGPTIDYITDDDRAEELTYVEFSAVIDLEGFKESLGYSSAADPGGLELETDWSVSYYKSVLQDDHPQYPGAVVYFLDHSRIEYIWVEVP